MEQCFKSCETLNSNHHGKLKITAKETEGARMGLLFDPKIQTYLIMWCLRVSKPSRRCQFMAGPASDDGVVRLSKRQGQVLWTNSAGLERISWQHKGPTFHFTSKGDSDLVFCFNRSKNAS